MFRNNMDFMLANGLTVYLKMTPAMLLTPSGKITRKASVTEGY